MSVYFIYTMLFLSIGEFAKKCGYSRQYIHRLLKEGRIDGAEWNEGFKRWRFTESAKITNKTEEIDVVGGLQGYLSSEKLNVKQACTIVAIWMVYCKGQKGTVYRLRRHLEQQYAEKIDTLVAEARKELLGKKIKLRDFIELMKVF